MLSSDFQCLARVAYESSEDSQDGANDATVENGYNERNPISPTPLPRPHRNFDLVDLDHDTSKVPRVSDIYPWYISQVGHSKNKESRRLSLDNNTSTNSSITSSTPRDRSKSNKNRYTRGLLDVGKGFLSNTSSRAVQLSSATLSSTLLSSQPSVRSSIQEDSAKLQQAFKKTDSNRKRTFTSIFEKNSTVSPMNENINIREIQFGPSFIQKKDTSTDDLEDDPLVRHSDKEGGPIVGDKSPINLDHSPSRGFHSNRNAKQPNGQLMAMLNSVRRQKEESWMRLTSGSYPPTNNMNDPRSRATSYVDITILSDPKKNLIPSTGDKFVLYRCFVHSIVCKKTQQDGKPTLLSTSYRRRSKKIHLLHHEPSNLYPFHVVCFRNEEFESTSRWICFSVDILKGMVPCRGSCLRVYDPFVVPLKLEDLCDMNSTSSSSGSSRILLCSRLYEPCPDNYTVPNK